jgi:hypothetical protein
VIQQWTSQSFPALAAFSDFAPSSETPELRRAFINCNPSCLDYFSGFTASRAISSVVERLLHTQEVAGSNPASRTTFLLRSEGVFGLKTIVVDPKRP